MTTDNPFATSLPPTVRGYLDIEIESRIQKETSPLIESCRNLISCNKALQDKIDTLELRLSNHEKSLRDDSRYTLTRAKIVRLMKELGIK